MGTSITITTRNQMSNLNSNATCYNIFNLNSNALGIDGPDNPYSLTVRSLFPHLEAHPGHTKIEWVKSKSKFSGSPIFPNSKDDGAAAAMTSRRRGRTTPAPLGSTLRWEKREMTMVGADYRGQPCRAHCWYSSFRFFCAYGCTLVVFFGFGEKTQTKPPFRFGQNAESSPNSCLRFQVKRGRSFYLVLGLNRMTCK